MKTWLVKSEPSSWSFEDQKREKTTPWDGVRNYQAAKNLKAMDIGDLVFFYHSINGKEIVGLVRVVSQAYIDPKDESGRFVAVDMEFCEEFKNTITLEFIKNHPVLQKLPLVKQSRLSVMPIDAESFDIICDLGRGNVA